MTSLRRSSIAACVALALSLASWESAAPSLFALPAAETRQAPADQATTAARDTLQRYATALESLDASAVKRVQPSINIDNLSKAFRDMRELKVDIDTLKVLATDATTMRVSCRVTQTLTPKAGARQTTAVNRVIRLRRDATAWVIDAFER